MKTHYKYREVYLNPTSKKPIANSFLEYFERRFGPLPQDYIELLQEQDGGSAEVNCFEKGELSVYFDSLYSLRIIEISLEQFLEGDYDESNSECQILEHDLLPIGDAEAGHAFICLGYKEHNWGEVYLWVQSTFDFDPEDNPIFLAKDLPEFFAHLFEYDEEGIVQKTTPHLRRGPEIEIEANLNVSTAVKPTLPKENDDHQLNYLAFTKSKAYRDLSIEITEVEQLIQHPLPESYRNFLILAGGDSPSTYEILTNKKRIHHISNYYTAYNQQHSIIKGLKKGGSYSHFLPYHILPIATTDNYDYNICICFAGERTGHICIWGDREKSPKEPIWINESFDDFLRSLKTREEVYAKEELNL